MDLDERWYVVTATVVVQADTANAAVNRIAHAIRDRERGHEPVFPVGVFNARPTSDPLMEVRRT
jgi:hypothetical protein